MEANHHELIELLVSALPVELRQLPALLRSTAEKLDFTVAFSGGIPRDLVRMQQGQLHVELFAGAIHDIDLVVCGDPHPQHGSAGVAFATELNARLRGELTLNTAFHTATIRAPDGIRIDITTARREYYPAPGVLPEVEVGGVSLIEDLSRRDFTFAALALELTHTPSRLVDTTGGTGDIRDRLVRVLHSQSFSDDPTRIFRALRYAVRLEFDLEPTTRTLLLQAIEEGLLDLLSPERVRYELECISNEPRWLEIWALLDLTGVLASLVPELGGLSGSWELETGNAVDIVLRNNAELALELKLPPWLVRTAWVLSAAPRERLEHILGRFGIHPRQAACSRDALRLADHTIPKLTRRPEPSEVVRLLEQYSLSAVALAFFIYQPATQAEVAARRELRNYLETYRHVRCSIDGHQMIELGLKPGPLIDRIRDEIRYARVDGNINSAEEEQELARQLIAEYTKSGNGHLAAEEETDNG